MKNFLQLLLVMGVILTSSCDKDDDTPVGEGGLNPETAPKVSVDRFSEGAGNLFSRDANSDLPGANEPINFDEEPFITKGFGPLGEIVQYYNFDVMPTEPAPIYVLLKDGEPVPEQLNIIDVIPGDEGYNDFWLVHEVTVPADYQANTITSEEELMAAGYDIEVTDRIGNCPVVPEGSTAGSRFNDSESNALIRGWYKDQVVFYFTFKEKALTASSSSVPTSGIRVTFNINPDVAGGGPSSGFVTEADSDQTHNVLQTIPEDLEYSPLWHVGIYDNIYFDEVSNWETANSVEAAVGPLVNCPVVSVELNLGTALDPETAPKVSVDRFSEEAGSLFSRDANSELPGANEPINFDEEPFITKGFGPLGEIVQYYNFDVMPTEPAPIYVLLKDGEPVPEQLNIIDVIPGDEGYNDFWLMHEVTVPADYQANTITSKEELMAAGYVIEVTDRIGNCPVVPEGSTAGSRLNDSESNALIRGWYKDQVVFYFTFKEKALTASSSSVPISGIRVTFNINPDVDGGGPPSGFVTETDSDQTHNVLQTIPENTEYSPLWLVDIYDNTYFDEVSNWETANSVEALIAGAALVNCPVVSVE